MYPYLSLVARKVAEFYHNIDKWRYLIWLKTLVIIAFFRIIDGVFALEQVNAVFSLVLKHLMLSCLVALICMGGLR